MMAVMNSSGIIEVNADTGSAIVSPSSPALNILGTGSLSTSASGNEVVITGTGGGGGGGNWTFITSIPAIGSSVAYGGSLSGYDQIRVIYNNVRVSYIFDSTLYRTGFSTDGGTTFVTISGTYIQILGSGSSGVYTTYTNDQYLLTPFTPGVFYYGFMGNLLSQKKPMETRGGNRFYIMQTTSPINYIQVYATGGRTYTSGTIEFWGK